MTMAHSPNKSARHIYLYFLVTCPALHVSNGNINYTGVPADGGYRVDVRAITTCNSGFWRTGSYRRQCNTNGEWSGEPTACIGNEL